MDFEGGKGARKKRSVRVKEAVLGAGERKWFIMALVSRYCVMLLMLCFLQRRIGNMAPEPRKYSKGLGVFCRTKGEQNGVIPPWKVPGILKIPDRVATIENIWT